MLKALEGDPNWVDAHGSFMAGVLASGFSAQLTLIVSVVSDAWWVQVVVVAAVLGLGQMLVGFPLRVVRGFWLPRRFGLLHQPLGSWLADGAKAAALGAVLGLGGLLVVYGLLRVTPWWWLIAAVVFFVVGCFAGWVVGRFTGSRRDRRSRIRL